MNNASSAPGSRQQPERGLLTLAATALIAGGATGIVGAAFRTSLDAADRWRNIMITSAHTSAVPRISHGRQRLRGGDSSSPHGW